MKALKSIADPGKVELIRLKMRILAYIHLNEHYFLFLGNENNRNTVLKTSDDTKHSDAPYSYDVRTVLKAKVGRCDANCEMSLLLI